MEHHTVQEHGVGFKGKYSEVGYCEGIIVGKDCKRGQTRCAQCGAFYNNRKRPNVCICGTRLGIESNNCGSLNAFQLTDNLYSVRQHENGVRDSGDCALRKQNVLYATVFRCPSNIRQYC